MAELLRSQHVERNCVNKDEFYKKITDLKKQQKNSLSPLTLYFEDSFYEKAKEHLRSRDRTDSIESQDKPLILTKWEQNAISRKKWRYSNGIILKESKQVVPKCQLYEVLTKAHERVAHRGREKTEKWLIDAKYSEISQKVIQVFVALCKFHQEQKTITDRVKPVKNPMQGEVFLNLLEIDLMDFRNLKCNCTDPHNWVMNLIDHHTKFISVYPLHSKKAEEVVRALQSYCYTYGYPQQILSDNGAEFRNKLMEKFAQENGIVLKHGSPRTPTTQGLVERANRTWKEDMRTIIMTKVKASLTDWCQFTMEACYIMNITHHRAIGISPYEAVFGVKPHREVHKNYPQHTELCQPDEEIGTSTKQTSSEEPKSKRQKITFNQCKYNEGMIKQTEKRKNAKTYEVGDMVAIQIEKPDKITALHPRMLLGQIVQKGEQNYVKVATEFGKVKGFIAPNRLHPCTATNVNIVHDKEISFTRACQSARDQCQ